MLDLGNPPGATRTGDHGLQPYASSLHIAALQPSHRTSRSIHTHPFHLAPFSASIKGSQITHRSPVDGRRQPEVPPEAGTVKKDPSHRVARAQVSEHDSVVPPA
eukprot:2221421-Prymnesium_polylepis.2